MWWILRIISKSGVFPLNMESTAGTRETTRPRRGPLHTCGASVLAIAHIVCTNAQDFDSPIGSTAKKRIIPFMPLLYAMQYQWLVSLSFIDDRLLAVANIVEFIFPPSKRLFNKIDQLVYAAEFLPENFDHVLNSHPALMHRFISWLTYALTLWGSEDNSNSTREKEIRIDMNSSKSESADCYPLDYSQQGTYNEPSNGVQTEKVKPILEQTVEEAFCPDETPCTSSFELATSSPFSVFLQDDVKSVGEKGKSDNMKCSYKEILESDNMKCSTKEILETDNMKCSYKEILEKGANENCENEVHDVLKEYPKGTILKDKLFGTSRPLN